MEAGHRDDPRKSDYIQVSNEAFDVDVWHTAQVMSFVVIRLTLAD